MNVSMIGGKNSTNRNEDLSLKKCLNGLLYVHLEIHQRINDALKRKRNAKSKLLLLGKEISTIVKQII
jgi:hypothetical protein